MRFLAELRSRALVNVCRLVQAMGPDNSPTLSFLSSPWSMWNMKDTARCMQEAAGLRGQVQALQEEVAALQEDTARLQGELAEAAAARKAAEATARESSVALKQKDAELALAKMTHDSDMQRQQESLRKIQVRPRMRCHAVSAPSRTEAPTASAPNCPI